jgi:hypothetical protein
VKLDRDRRSASYSERRLGFGYGVSAVSIGSARCRKFIDSENYRCTMRRLRHGGMYEKVVHRSCVLVHLPACAERACRRQVKTCECHASNSSVWHYCHAGYYCHTFDGSCRK